MKLRVARKVLSRASFRRRGRFIALWIYRFQTMQRAMKRVG